MTLSPWIFYFAELGQSVSVLLCLGGLIGLCLAALVTAFCIVENIPPTDGGKRKMRRLVVGSAVCLVVACVIPSKQTVAMMVLAPAITNSEFVQKELPEVYQLAKEALKQSLQSE
jgi:hypothetical protein